MQRWPKCLSHIHNRANFDFLDSVVVQAKVSISVWSDDCRFQKRARDLLLGRLHSDRRVHRAKKGQPKYARQFGWAKIDFGLSEPSLVLQLFFLGSSQLKAGIFE